MDEKINKESFTFLVEANKYVKPVIKEVTFRDWVLNGENNSFFDDIIEAYDGSPTNAAIINGYSAMIYGKGLVIDPGFEELLKVLPKKDVKRVSSDFKLFGSAAFQVIYGKGDGALRRPVSIKHLDRKSIAPAKMNKSGEIEYYFHCRDWKKANITDPDIYAAFGTSTEDVEVFVITPYKAGKYYFSDPDYLSGMQYAKIEEEISNYSLNHILNGFSAGTLINCNNGVPETEEDQRNAKRKLLANTTGSSKAGNTIVSFNNSKETATTVQELPNNSGHKQWDYLSTEARNQIMVAHRVTSPLLFGIKDASGFSSNAAEMETGLKILYATVISDYQEEIIDAFNEVLSLVNPNVTGLAFEDLIDFIGEDGESIEDDETVELSASKKKIQTEIDQTPAINYLLDKGEDEDLENYTLISEDEVTLDNTITDFSLELANVAKSAPAKKSEQDSVLFKVRYSYAPATTSDNSREFCKKMVSASKVYRKEDIEAAGDLVVNKGLGKDGADTYSIWLYKGGVNCKHFWQRKIYLKTNNTQISVSKARAMILELDPSVRKDVRFPVNDPKVAQVASSKNNNWKA